MVDEISVAPIVGLEVEAPTPVAPVAAPTPVEAAVAPTPTPASAPIAPETPTEGSTEAPVTTLLAEPPKEPTAPEAAPKATEEGTKDPKEAPKAAEEAKEGQSDETAPPVFDAWTFPDGVTPKETTLKEFTELLSGLETDGKADHAKLQEFGQKAVDFYQKELQQAVTDLNTLYQKTWDDTKVKWKESFLNDPEIGGNRAQTTLNSALSFLRTHGGTPEQQTEFRTLMDQTGLGNHPIMIRLMANAGRVMAEGKPLAAQAPPAVAKSKINTMYGNKANYINK